MASVSFSGLFYMKSFNPPYIVQQICNTSASITNAHWYPLSHSTFPCPTKLNNMQKKGRRTFFCGHGPYSDSGLVRYSWDFINVNFVVRSNFQMYQEPYRCLKDLNAYNYLSELTKHFPIYERIIFSLGCKSQKKTKKFSNLRLALYLYNIKILLQLRISQILKKSSFHQGTRYSVHKSTE